MKKIWKVPKVNRNIVYFVMWKILSQADDQWFPIPSCNPLATDAVKIKNINFEEFFTHLIYIL